MSEDQRYGIYIDGGLIGIVTSLHSPHVTSILNDLRRRGMYIVFDNDNGAERAIKVRVHSKREGSLPHAMGGDDGTFMVRVKPCHGLAPAQNLDLLTWDEVKRVIFR